MYAKYSQVVYLGRDNNHPQKYSNFFKLKQHHHVCLDAEFKLYCAVWRRFLSDDQGTQQVVCRPMVDLFDRIHSAEDLSFFSDASAAKNLGFGAILKSSWIKGDWSEEFITNCEPSIEYLELYALCTRVLTWNSRPEMSNTRILAHCDNMAVVHMFNNLSSKCRNCMWLLRILVLDCLKFNRKITTAYINTKE